MIFYGRTDLRPASKIAPPQRSPEGPAGRWPGRAVVHSQRLQYGDLPPVYPFGQGGLFKYTTHGLAPKTGCFGTGEFVCQAGLAGFWGARKNTHWQMPLFRGTFRYIWSLVVLWFLGGLCGLSMFSLW